MENFNNMPIVVVFVNEAATPRHLIAGFGLLLVSQMAQIKPFLDRYYGEKMKVSFHSLSEVETIQRMTWGKLVSLYIGNPSPEEMKVRVYLQEFTTEDGPSGRQPKWADHPI